MCDTFVALPVATADGSLLLAKNSDREPDEAQGLVHLPRQTHTQATLTCTYITIPQVAETYECILSKPFQIWGAEMGANEFGVAIGNEAVFTKVRMEKHNNGLTGMDLLRLALERSKTAAEAIDCITSLLLRHGQNACGGYRNTKFYYHNSFIIADPQEAWVLETAGKEWATEKVRDIRSISNALSIGRFADTLSPGAKSFAQKKGWWKDQDPFDFGVVYSDWLYTTVGRAAKRQACTTELSMRQNGRLTVQHGMTILQTHNLKEDAFKPSKANTGSVCMHATGFLNPSSTTGSMVAALRQQEPHTVWLTGTSNPCLSVYVPFFFGTTVMSNIAQPTANPDNSFWWKAEKVHRWIGKDYQKRKNLINTERLKLQQDFLFQEEQLINQHASLQELEKFSRACLQTTEMLIDKWLEFVN